MPSPFHKVPEIKIPGLEFRIVEVTPELAAEWLKRNVKNRKVRESTLEPYTRDMINGDWLLTHQSIAFDDKGNLIDGQHRLLSIVRSRTTVRLFVTAGWPTGAGKRKTMDAVDRGANRSIADQLRLQHGIQDAGPVVQIANAIACACLNSRRVRKGSTASVLAVVGLFPDEIKYVLDTRATQLGIRSAHVAAAVAMGRAIWPEKTSDFWTRLRTGENLSRDNPVLHLRNYLTSATRIDNDEIRNATMNCLKMFVEGKPLTHFSGAYVKSFDGRTAIVKALEQKVKKVCKIYQSDLPEPIRNGEPTQITTAKEVGSPFGPEAIAIGATLSQRFTVTDLRARLDGDSSIWLVHWRQRGWIETGAPGQFIKTATFPAPPVATS